MDWSGAVETEVRFAPGGNVVGMCGIELGYCGLVQRGRHVRTNQIRPTHMGWIRAVSRNLGPDAECKTKP